MVTAKTYALPTSRGPLQITQHFFGVAAEIKQNIVATTQLNESPSQATSEKDVADIAVETEKDINHSLAAYGYFKPTIVHVIHRFAQTATIDYKINSGPLLKITKLDVSIKGEGIRDGEFQQALAQLPIRQGDPLRSKLYQKAKSNLINLAAQKGYFKAHIEESHIYIDLKKYQAAVVIHFDSGPRYRFGEVIFRKSPYSISFLKRFISFEPGQPYLTRQVIKLQEDLSQANQFQQVTVTPVLEKAQGLQVPIEVTVIPKKCKQYIFGAGYGTDTGVRGLAGIQLHRVNPYGHYLDAMIQASEKKDNFIANYTIPGTNPVTDLYRFTLAAEYQHLPTSGKSRNERIEAGLIKNLWGIQQTLSLSLRDEHSEPTDNRPTITSTMLMPNLNWSYIQSDDFLDPNYGYEFNLNLRGATRALISNTDFAQGLAQSKVLIPVTNCTRLLLKAELGYTLITNINNLPLSLQFFTGGAQTVRGYQYQEIGPGRTLLMGSVELQQRLINKIYGVVFYDAGNASNEFIGNFKQSVGTGILWRSPIGVIEISYARALKDRHNLIQVSMGPLL